MAKQITRIKSSVSGEEFIFGEALAQETVIVTLNAPTSANDVVWTDYAVKVTITSTGDTQSIPLSRFGTCAFKVDFGQEYKVQLPVFGAYIAPAVQTYVAFQSTRDIVFSYMMSGVFGLDRYGKRYSLADCEALVDKSIIVAGGYIDEALANSSRDDGSTGNGFMWDLHQEAISAKWAASNVAFDQNLLPFVTSDADALKQCNGEAYTRYIISEGIRLGTDTPAATICSKKTLTIGTTTKSGYLLAYGQLRRLAINITSFNALYAALGLTAPTITNGNWWSSCQHSATDAVTLFNGSFYDSLKSNSGSVLVGFDL